MILPAHPHHYPPLPLHSTSNLRHLNENHEDRYDGYRRCCYCPGLRGSQVSPRSIYLMNTRHNNSCICSFVRTTYGVLSYYYSNFDFPAPSLLRVLCGMGCPKSDIINPNKKLRRACVVSNMAPNFFNRRVLQEPKSFAPSRWCYAIRHILSAAARGTDVQVVIIVFLTTKMFHDVFISPVLSIVHSRLPSTPSFLPAHVIFRYEFNNDEISDRQRPTLY